MAERIGYDELLHSRVEQLKLLDELIEPIQRAASKVLPILGSDLKAYRNTLTDMIRKAEAEHTAF